MAVDSQSLVWRPMAVSDAAALADLLNAIDAEDHVWGQYTAQDAAEELDSPVDDLPTSTLAVFDGSTMLGFSAVHHKPVAEIVHRVHAAGAVPPTIAARDSGRSSCSTGWRPRRRCTPGITPRSSWSSNPSTASTSTGPSPSTGRPV